MDVNTAWTITHGLPVKLLNGSFGRISKVDMENFAFIIEIPASKEILTLPFESVNRIKPGRDALVEIENESLS